MNLFQNPFYIIGVSTRDSKQEIVEACDAKSLTVDADLCARIRTDLTAPRNRLSAELAWLPGLSPARALGLIEKLEKDPKSFLASLDGINPLARCNALVTYLEHRRQKEEYQINALLIEIAQSFEKIDFEKLLIIVNEDRQIAKIPLVQDIDSIKQVMRSRCDYMIDVMKNSLNNVKAPDKVLTEIITKTTTDGKQQPPILIEELTDKYQIEVQKYLDQLVGKIKNIISNIEQQPKKFFDHQMPSLYKCVKTWEQIAQPIQLIQRSKGIDDPLSKELAQDLRGLAIDMANSYEMHTEAKQITKVIAEIFKELPQFAERVSEDLTVLDGIIEKKKRSDEEERKWRDEMSLDIEIGKIIKDRLIITPERISYKNRTVRTEDVSRVRWGIYVQYINGIPSSYYTIWIGTPTEQLEIECNTTFDSKAVVEKRYQTILDKLWKNVCIRLIGQTLQRLSDGEKLVYNDIVVDKDGILLRKKKLLGSDPLYAKWEELSINNAPGAFVISATKEKKANSTLSYRNVDNVHILEAVMRFLWKDSNYLKLSHGEFSRASEMDDDTNVKDQNDDDDEPIEDGIADNDGDELIKVRCPHCSEIMTVALRLTPRGSKVICSICSLQFYLPK